jgi:hypothetical protein
MPETDLDAIFDRLETSLERYVPPFVVRSGGIPGKRDYQLWSGKTVEIEGRKRNEVYFAGLIVQKGYVGFYFMPVYTHAGQKLLFAPELLALLKGKSCFHVRRLDDDLVAHVERALAAGFALYRERGWVDEGAT